MEIGILFWLGLVFAIAIASVALKQFIAAASIRSVADEWCTMKGLDLVELTVISQPHNLGHAPFPGKLSMRIRRKATGDVEVWSGTWELAFFRARILDVHPDRVLNEPGHRQVREPAPDLVNDPEAAIMAEVSRRIDQITGQPGWAGAHDLDGSGHVDEEEFRVLRDRVLAEVRAEFAALEGSHSPWPSE